MEYVLGFAFNSDHTKVALIRKNRPEWQAGKLNGIGGKIELMENPIDAIVREFREETTVETTDKDWRLLCRLLGESFNVIVFTTLNVNLDNLKSATDEEIVVESVSDVLNGNVNTISNLPWMIAMARDQDFVDGRIRPANIMYG